MPGAGPDLFWMETRLPAHAGMWTHAQNSLVLEYQGSRVKDRSHVALCAGMWTHAFKTGLGLPAGSTLQPRTPLRLVSVSGTVKQGPAG